MNRPLDRERIPEYKLTISVKDNPENPRIARRVRLEGTGRRWEEQGWVLETLRRPGQGVRCTGPGVSKCWIQTPILPVSGCVTLASQFLLASVLLFFCKLKTTRAPKLRRGLEGASICKSSAQSLAHGKHSVSSASAFSLQTTGTWAHAPGVCAYGLHALTNTARGF